MKTQPVRTRAALLDPDRFTVSVEDHAYLTGRGIANVREAVRRGEIPCIRSERIWRIPASYTRLVLGIALPTDVMPTVNETTKGRP